MMKYVKTRKEITDFGLLKRFQLFNRHLNTRPLSFA